MVRKRQFSEKTSGLAKQARIKREDYSHQIRRKKKLELQEHKIEEAGISRTNRSAGKKTYTFDKPPELDTTTPEGAKEWEAYKVEMKKQGY